MEDVSRATASAFDELAPELSADLDAASQPYVGRWNQLVSTTNWEKGRIIQEWRDALLATDAPASEYSDEAWSQRVGGVTSQHVGRLRRVFQRFGATCDKYVGLYWSHFQAALDWDDAEMWLEGASQSAWSVSRMRNKRWETLGAVAADQPREEDIVAAEVDEDFDPEASRPEGDGSRDPGPREGTSPLPEGPDFGEEDAMGEGRSRDDDDSGPSIYVEDERDSIEFVRPFENLGELPEDLAEAFDAFKLAILRHKTESWEQISRDDVLAALDALKELVKAPSADASPF